MIRDMWSMVAGFLEDDRMEFFRKPPQRYVWDSSVQGPDSIALEHREAVLVMHEVAVCVEKSALPAGFGLRKTRHRKYRGHGFRKGFMTRTGNIADEGLCSWRGGPGIVGLRASAGAWRSRG